MDKKRTAYKIGRNFEIDHIGMKVQNEKKTKKTEKNMLAKYVNVGYYLLTPLLGGVFLGVVLDNIFHTKPLMTLIGIGVGTLSTLYNLKKIATPSSEKEKPYA